MRNKIITSFFCLLLAVSTLAGLLLLRKRKAHFDAKAQIYRCQLYLRRI